MKTDRTVIVSQYTAEYVRQAKASGEKVNRRNLPDFKKRAETEVRGHENFLGLLDKLIERLILIRGCVTDGLYLTEGDTLVLKEVFRIWDEDRLHWLSKKQSDAQWHIQKVLFSDNKDDLDQEVTYEDIHSSD